MEGRPFHLLAAHCQRGEKSTVVSYIRSKGLAEDTPNMTVSSFGGHPNVKGNGYVPYYMVFDHTGALRHHHMCGAYHGGDGMKMIEWVERLVGEAPAIYLGDEPFEHYTKLASQVAKGEGIAKALATLESVDDTQPEAARAEAKRLLDALATWRDGQLARVDHLMATKPDAVLAALGTLGKAMGPKAKLAEPVFARSAALKGSPDLAAAVKIQKLLEKTKRKIERLKVPKDAKRRGVTIFDPSDSACRAEHAKTLDRAAKKLRDATADHPDLPIATTANAYAKLLAG